MAQRGRPARGQLTEKQKKFCENIVSGMGYAEAYLNAYDGHSKAGAYNESSKLMKRADILEEIGRLSKPLEDAFHATQLSEREKQIKFIIDRIELCRLKEDEQSIIRYTDMLNKIFGLYKIQDAAEKEENQLSNLDTNALLKLVK